MLTDLYIQAYTFSTACVIQRTSTKKVGITRKSTPPHGVVTAESRTL